MRDVKLGNQFGSGFDRLSIDQSKLGRRLFRFNHFSPPPLPSDDENDEGSGSLSVTVRTGPNTENRAAAFVGRTISNNRHQTKVAVFVVVVLVLVAVILVVVAAAVVVVVLKSRGDFMLLLCLGLWSLSEILAKEMRRG